MSGILYLNPNYLSADRVWHSLWKEFDISLCTNYREARKWVRDLDPYVLLVSYDPLWPGLADMLGSFLEEDDRHRLIAIHGEGEAERTRESIRRSIGRDGRAARIIHVDDDISSIRQALLSLKYFQERGPAVAVLQGVSKAIRTVNETLEKYAPSEFPVLIRGESGTGKELAARRIHEASPRRQVEMIALDCGALPEHLTESMLFGSEKGAFTDAVEQRGALEEAAGGTLFLDEIGNLSLPGQCKLLRVLESGDYRRLGGKKTRRAEFRLVSATSLDIRKAIRAGGFRNDLYHRVNTLILDIPPLRSRPEDIEPLAVLMCLEHSGGACIPGREAIDKLLSHDWPGNVRELRNTIQRAIVLNGYKGELGGGEIIFS